MCNPVAVKASEELHARSKGFNFSGYEPTQLISEHKFLCAAKHSSERKPKVSEEAIRRKGGGGGPMERRMG